LQGIQGIQGEKGEKGDQGDQGLVGPQGLIGPRGLQGERGLPGEKGDQGEVGPQGPMGSEGPRGEKGEKRDRGPVGPEGPVGPKGERGIPGESGPAGKDGESPVIEAEFPLVLEDGVLYFDSEHVSGLLDRFKNTDIQNALNNIAKSNIPGGGAVGIIYKDANGNRQRIIKSVNDIIFTGSGVSITPKRKNVEINISGSGAGVSKIVAGNGIQLTPSSGTGEVRIDSVATVKGSNGQVQFTSPSGYDLASYPGLQFNTDTLNFSVPTTITIPDTINISNPGSFIKFSNGSTMGFAPPIFTESTAAPSITQPGDRWFNTKHGNFIYSNHWLFWLYLGPIIR
jgi:hypothetical protein